ncbi:MAG: gamma-D-glutamyl-meso-diaminopimelate peptidase [Clostridia bacterium]|nr:gamma-D-glutamyl-meso-diaminopimelate peptidase [Clostridia bacterium]
MTDGRFFADDGKEAGYDEVAAEVERLAGTYPRLTVRVLGTSVLGRPIPMLVIGSEDAGQSVLMVGAHHGMEHVTAAFLLRYVREVCEAERTGRMMYSFPPSAVWRDRAVYVVPMLNPDGCELAVRGLSAGCPLGDALLRMNGGGDFSRWQANARGVDLNHNYDAGFSAYREIERERGITPGRTLWSGPAPESEPETAALAGFLRAQSSVRAVLSLHTQGEEIYYTSGGRAAPRGRETAKLLARLTGYRLAEPEGTAAYGGLTDWCIGTLGKPAFTLECGRGENPLPASDFFGIYVTIREMLHTFPMLF